MKLFTRRGKGVLVFAILFVTLLGFGASISAQEMEKPGVAVYVVGGLPDNEKKVLGSYLLAAIVNSGQEVSTDYADAFLAAAMGEARAKQDGVLSENRVCELGRHYKIRYLCVASVTSAFDFFIVSIRMVDTQTEKTVLKGEAQSPLKTMEDLTEVSNKIAESMFGVSIPAAQAKTESQQASSQSAGDGASPTVVSVAGEAKVVVDRVVAAVNAFKDATSKSIAAANAVKTATQSKNFSAIKDAKQKVESAAEAVKKAKADVEAAIAVLNSSGPEAGAAVKAMGIDLSMFGGSADEGGEGDEYSGKEKNAHFYFAPKYMLPVGTPVSWGGVNLEFGWVWRNGVLFGMDINFGLDGDNWLVGGGLSVGKEYTLWDQMQIACGGTAGFWYIEEKEKYEYSYNYYDSYYGYRTVYDDAYRYNKSYNFLAPFVKYRWNSLEVTYRGLMGITGGGGFGYNSHQTMVGYYIAAKSGGGDDFSVGRRFGTWALNLVSYPPLILPSGAGSFFLMKDYVGGGIMLGSSAVGMGFIVLGGSYPFDYGLFGVGIACIVGSHIFNIVRSATYHKPKSKMDAANFKLYDGLKFAIVPTESGDFKALTRYDYTF